MSYLKVVSHTSLFTSIAAIDRELADRCRRGRCIYCQGPLHSAHYLRKPRGSPFPLPVECCLRHSFCCGHCRHRTQPPSLLFWGRKVYLGCVIVLLVGVVQGLEPVRLQSLCDEFGVTRRTIKRWLAYFRESFPSSGVWKRIRGHVGPQVDNCNLPYDLLVWVFPHHRSPQQALIACLRLLAGVVDSHEIWGSSPPSTTHAKDAEVTMRTK